MLSIKNYLLLCKVAPRNNLALKKKENDGSGSQTYLIRVIILNGLEIVMN